MTLAEKLRERAAFSGRTAQVECGELGSLTVEALPVREIELLLRESDGQRKLFYTACRELQRAGEELRRAGQIYQPDGILQFVSDDEAALAARTILELSGWTGENHVYSPLRTGETERIRKPSVLSEQGEVRLLSVQKTEKDFSQIRPEVVQSDDSGSKNMVQKAQNRLATVQLFSDAVPESGQDSREIRPENHLIHKLLESDTKPQGLGQFLPEAPQNVVRDFREAGNVPQDTDDGTMPLHETESEFPEISPGSLHETESEFPEKKRETMHETESEFFGTDPSAGLMERQNLHEIKSELRKILHETESEFGEVFARQLLEGLRRAKWVRGT